MKDYWKMTDEELKGLAGKYKLPSHHKASFSALVGEDFDRERVIHGLVFRDNSRRATWALIISILALMVSIASIILSLVKK
jgi:hypothetical protein